MDENHDNLYKDVEYIDEKPEKKKKKKKKTVQDEEAEQERKIWEEKVANFLPTDLLTLKIKPRQSEVLNQFKLVFPGRCKSFKFKYDHSLLHK